MISEGTTVVSCKGSPEPIENCPFLVEILNLLNRVGSIEILFDEAVMNTNNDSGFKFIVFTPV